MQCLLPLHDGDLGLLLHDDFLCNAPKLLVMAVAQLRLRHVDCALMMGNHLPDEILVDIPSRRSFHAGHHRTHGRLGGRQKGSLWFSERANLAGRGNGDQQHGTSNEHGDTDRSSEIHTNPHFASAKLLTLSPSDLRFMQPPHNCFAPTRVRRVRQCSRLWSGRSNREQGTWQSLRCELLMRTRTVRRRR